MAKILMIDDDPDAILVMQVALQSRGHDFYSANDSKAGLEKVKEVDPDLIILDVMMDTATEGFQTAHLLRDRSPDAEYAEYRDIPILMLTSVHDTTELRFGPDRDYLPVEVFLDKSTDPDEIIATAEELLN